ncbi:hypothetical protein [Vibrio owensii]|uniref:hypothetical protein n=1 Tax=Vibrio harveyi group TaxID=717610 RepID=UPI003CC664E0
MNKIPLAVVAVSTLALSQAANAGVKIKLHEDSQATEQVASIMHALVEVEKSRGSFDKESIVKAFEVNGEVLGFNIEMVNADAAPSQGAGIGGCCHGNCHSNCHRACHGSRSWR